MFVPVALKYRGIYSRERERWGERVETDFSATGAIWQSLVRAVCAPSLDSLTLPYSQLRSMAEHRTKLL